MSGIGPTASLVQSVVAAGLADPTRLRGWATDPTSLEALGIAPATIDLDRLSNFAGLAEKVRHNQTRAMLPLSFRLLTTLGLDINLFSAYAQSPRTLRRGASPLDRIDALAGFVEDWAGDDVERTLVRDLVRHEHALTQLRARESTPVAPLPLPMRSELALRGDVLVRRLTIDPRQLVDVLRHQHPPLATIERGAWVFVYQRDPSSGIVLLEVEPAVGDLLMLVGDDRSLADLGELLETSPDSPALGAVLDQLVDAGLLTWRR